MTLTDAFLAQCFNISLDKYAAHVLVIDIDDDIDELPSYWAMTDALEGTVWYDAIANVYIELNSDAHLWLNGRDANRCANIEELTYLFLNAYDAVQDTAQWS